MPYFSSSAAVAAASSPPAVEGRLTDVETSNAFEKERIKYYDDAFVLLLTFFHDR